MSKETKIREKKKPLFIEAISMIVVLLALVIYSVKLDISIIPAMMIAIVWSMVIAYRCGYGWNDHKTGQTYTSVKKESLRYSLSSY
jgi:NhaC family Na+:H+ antiporter